MTHVEEIREIWQSNEVRNLSEILKKLLALISEAKSAGETIPLELETEIVLNANYSFGYGAEVEESRVLISLLHRLNSDDRTAISLSNLYRLTCTAASSLLTVLSSDAFTSTRHGHQLFPWNDFDLSTDLEDILLAMLEEILEVIHPGRISYWLLETISFAVTYLTIIETQDDVTSLKKRCKSQIYPILEQSIGETDKQLLKKWRSEWTEKNDYCRFVGLMIINKNLSEEAWLDNISYVTGQEKK